jgi:ribosomal protein L23
MTRLDVKNYLTQIYKVPVMDVKTLNLSGKHTQFVRTDPGANPTTFEFTASTPALY